MHGRSLGLLVAFLALPATARAETVTIAGDSGPGSLRALVGQANTDPGPDFIDFADGLGPITLASSLAITDALTVGGPATVTLAPGASISVSSAAQSKLGGLTIGGSEPAVRVLDGGDLLVQQGSLTGIEFAGGSAGALGGLTGFGTAVIADGDGVVVGADADVNVSHNTIVSTAGDAVRVASHQAQVFSNTLQGGTGHAGLALTACDDAQVITQNTIGGDGVGVDVGAAACQVGGTGEDDGNTITGAAGDGVRVHAAGAQILGNTITDNEGDGVRVEPGATARLSRNLISANGGLGIDTGPDGPSGPRPVLTSVFREEGGLRVRGTAPAAGGFSLELFASPACDAGGFGEGARVLGTVAFAVLSPGGAFDVLVPADADAGPVATATLTGADQATTEFSACATVTDEPGPGPGGPGPGGPGPGTRQYFPQSAITAPTRPRRARKVKAIRGTAVDAERVQVAVTRRGARCKALTKAGTLKRRGCRRPRWLAATGTVTWKLALRKRLPPGRYVIRSRATAPDGTVQAPPARVTVRLRAAA